MPEIMEQQEAAMYRERVKALLTPRWTLLKPHAEQIRLWNSKARFRVVPAGRRSGKTEIAKRYLVRCAMAFNSHPDGRFIAAAPVHDQAKGIFWDDIKRLIPEWMVNRVYETDRTIKLHNGVKIQVLGMDEPQRAEGSPLDGIIFDEYADMKKTVWTNHVRAALDTVDRPGWAWFIGVPEGRNHYFDLYEEARSGRKAAWAAFHWKSADILSPEAIAAAKEDLDELTFRQEYDADFVTFEGKVYYCFDPSVHVHRVKYNPDLPLITCWDFNVSPGVMTICQEQAIEDKSLPPAISRIDPVVTVLDEVHIPRNSNTEIVCRKFLSKFGQHQQDVLCYGDASGGAKSSAKVRGSDWDLIRDHFKPVFGQRLKMRYPRANPKERSRVNAVNSRFRSADGTVRVVVDPKCKFLIKDFEGVRYVQGGAGEIDKFRDPELTHLSDAFGYYINRRFPTDRQETVSIEYT